MNRFFILASLFFVSVACNKVVIEQIEPNNDIQTVTLTASLSGETDTRVSTDYTNDDRWGFEWEEYDAISAWHNDNCTDPVKFEMSDFDGNNSSFTGTLGSGDMHRFIYPHVDNITTTAEENYYMVDISSQNGDLAKTYLINDEQIETASIENNSITSLDMRHLGGFMVVDVYLDNFNNDYTYTLTKVVYSSSDNIIPVSAEIDMTKEIDDEDLYASTTSGAITAEVSEVFETVAGTQNQQAITRLNILPFTVKSGESAVIALTIEVSEGNTVINSLTSDITLTNNSDEAIPFARATHNFTKLTVDGTFGIRITGATINGWGIEVENGDLGLEDQYYTASEIDANNVPLFDTWVITDMGDITYNMMLGVKDALAAAVGEGRSIKIILSDATYIGPYAFDEWENLTSIELPQVTNIAQYAFSFCPALTEIATNSLESISESAFESSGLTSFDFEGVTSIGMYAFYYCSSLTEITNFSIESIPESAFEGTNLSAFDFEGVTSIGSFAFCSCSSLTEITNFSIESIPMYAFCESGLTSFDFDGVTSIGSFAFCSCSALTEITNFSIESIPESAFEGTNLSAFDFEGVTSIGSFAFCSCSALTEITNFSIESIPVYAFCESGLTSFDFDGVTSIGMSAFSNCAALAEVTNFNIETIPHSAFSGSALTTFDFSSVTSIGEQAFYSCVDLTAIELPSTVTSIGLSAFDQSGVSTVTLNWTDDEILDYENDYLWFDTSTLTTVYIPASTTDNYEAKGWIGDFTLVEKEQ